jgi:hypothetical protein|tara:strand:- start:242 stop:541 length:300 start_codon:yes stop_codon:yes gene_type:complete
MSLKDKKSLYDRSTLLELGDNVGGDPGFLFFGNSKNNSSPFLPSNGQRSNYRNDHMVDLLENSVFSPNSKITYSADSKPSKDLNGGLPTNGEYINNMPT